VNPYLYKSLSYKSEDFAPVSLVSRQPFAITVSPLVPSKSVSEFVNFGKGKSTPLTFATTGAGSMNHILGEWMGKTMGIKVSDIPYKGTGPAVIDLVAGRVDMQFEGITTAVPMHQSGKTRVVAVTSDERSPLLPDVPTLREAGYPDFVAYTYFGLLAPAATPRAVINKLHAAVVAAVSSPDFSQKVSASGESPLSSPTPKHYADLLRDENLRWGRIIAPMNIKLD